MVHPAQHIVQGDLFGQDRVQEYRVLGGQAFGDLLDRMGLELARLSTMLTPSLRSAQSSSLP